MAAATWYKDWFSSPFYHKLYFERDEREAEQFICNLLAHLQPPEGCRMLDVACGRGRHSKFLAASGYTVTGIDLSEKSIAFAKQFENETLEFFVHDMRLPFRCNYFHYAFNFFTSFGYFPTRREHDNAMRTIANSLVTGGVFVLDYLNVHYTEDHLVPEETKQEGATAYTINRWDDNTYFYKKITVEDPLLKNPIAFIEKVAKFSPGDFTDMLSYQGLVVRELFGDYDFSRFHIRNTPRLILIAEKKRA